MRQRLDDIVLVEGNNELNVQMTPSVPPEPRIIEYDTKIAYWQVMEENNTVFGVIDLSDCRPDIWVFPYAEQSKAIGRRGTVRYEDALATPYIGLPNVDSYAEVVITGIEPPWPGDAGWYLHVKMYLFD